MSLHLKPYGLYKDSGIAYIKEIPHHWMTVPLKGRCRIINGSTPKSGIDEYWDGSIVWVTPADLSKIESRYIENGERTISVAGYESCGTQLVPAGSVILSSRAPIGTVAIAKQAMATNQGCKSLVIGKDLDSEFLYYALSVSSTELNVLGRGTTFLELSSNELGRFQIACPELEEQTQIAKFLDYETAKIDALIAKQQQLIALLQEKRQAVISHAVTKGLNPAAPLRDSGVEWLGQVPAHWRVIALKHLVAVPIIDGPHETPIKRDEGIPFVSAESVSKGFIDFDKIWGYISREDHARYSKRYKPQLGDILMVKLGATTGVVAIVETEKDFNIWVPLAVIRPKRGIKPRFIFHMLRSDNLKNAYQINWTYGTQQTLGLRTISNLRLPIPPEQEMQEIVAYLDSILPLFESLSTKAEAAVELLQERRTALIAAAVTGKIDVRGWQPPPAIAEGVTP